MERFEEQLTAIIIFTIYDYFSNISFPCPLVHEINMIYLMQVLFSMQKCLLNLKKYGDRVQGVTNRKFWYTYFLVLQWYYLLLLTFNNF